MVRLHLAKAFILCALNRVYEYVSASVEVKSFPLDKMALSECLGAAGQDCESGDFSIFRYGTKYSKSDEKTHWTKAEHFNTW